MKTNGKSKKKTKVKVKMVTRRTNAQGYQTYNDEKGYSEGGCAYLKTPNGSIRIGKW